MNLRLLKLSLLLSIIIFQSCSTTKKSIFWVSGFKAECYSGSEKMNCLIINKQNNLNKPNWENFYANIEGFEFEEGIIKKIEVNEKKLEDKDVPMDASSIKYTLVKELKKQTDERVQLKGNWILVKLNDNPINRVVEVPTMGVSLNQMQVFGSGGCNNYSGSIENLTLGSIKFGNIANTLMVCNNGNIEREYHLALSSVETYTLKKDILTFYSNKHKKLLTFTRQQKTEAVDQRIQGIWNATRIFGESVNQMISIPRLEINLTDMRLFGNDSCNELNGKIEAVSATQLSFAGIALTRKICQNMTIADNFNKALNKIVSYKLDGLELILMDKDGNEVLAFLKGN